MSYIGNEPTSVAFLTDTFSGNGSTTAFTLSAAPAGTSSILVAITGVVQDPSTYSVVGTTLTFSPAPPTGTGNISVRFLGIPASGVTTTAYRTVTEFTATAGQTTFSVPSYTVGFIDVYRNGVMLGSADYTASNGLTVVLASGATAGDLVEVISMQVSSVLNAISSSPASVGTSNLANGAVTMAKLDSVAQYTGFKNRIINGDMTIDQRNNGASVAMTTGEVYSVDRFLARFSAGSGSSTQGQSSVAPTGFKNSLLINVTTGGTVTAAVRGLVATRIEGYNFADFGYGAAGASTFTMSFWVRSSLTGTFSGAFQNTDATRSYVFTYSVSAANTWEQKTITVVGDTTGTWLTTNGIGISINFDLGNGSDLKTGTTGSWIAGDFRGATGSVAPFATSGSTWYITGVQLEKGTVATSFDYLPYGTELMLCQRYCVKYGGNSVYEHIGQGNAYSTSSVQFDITLPTTMRAVPSYTVSGNWVVQDGNSNTNVTGFGLASGGIESSPFILSGTAGTAGGLTQFRPYFVNANNSLASSLIVSAEL